MRRLWIVVIIFYFFGSISSLELNYSILEESESDAQPIGNIADDSGIFSLLPNSEDRKYIRFSIVADNDGFSDHFRINDTSGDLYNTAKFDREALEICKYEDTCKLDIVVVAQSAETGFSFFQKVTVHIIVLDINDNSPTFPTNHTSLEISEASEVDSSFPLDRLSAVDLDKGVNSIQKYEIVPKNSPFSLNVATFVDGSASISIVLSSKLDRENVPSYLIQVLAIDGGDTPHTGTLYVAINVSDANDHAPQFPQKIYRITVNEDVSVGSTILILNATDADIGENGRVTYQLSRRLPSEIRTLFAINEQTGALTTSQSLISEPGTEYKIIVEAWDNADQPSSNQTEVYVTVLDSLNDPPEININFLLGTGFGVIPESERVGSAVAHIAVVDRDTGGNGDVSCQIFSEIFRLQNIQTNEYTLILNTSLNREVKDKYDVVLICMDKGIPPLNATKRFTVTVADVNDNSPQFSLNSYLVEVYENNDIGASIFKVVATDADQNENGEVEYSIVSNNDGFSVDLTSGVVRVNFRLDYETRDRYDFVITATDKGVPKRSSVATLQVNVLDRNDNKPVYDISIYTFTVEENRPPGIYIGNVSAEDVDSGKNGQIDYIIADNPQNSLPFKIYPNGSIYTTVELDRETNLNGYNFRIYARDRGDGSLNSSCHVTVFVTDVNDNKPTFLFPNSENYTIIVLYDVPQHSVIGKIEATDEDYDVNGRVTYSLIDTDDTPSPRLFNIDRDNGDVYLAQALTRQNLNRYVITINAEDHGNPKLSTNQSLVIVVTSHALPPEPQNDGERSDSYMLIAVVITCVTVIVAGIIVLFIFLIRRHDRKKDECNNSKLSSKPVNVVESNTYDALEKKKELSLVTDNKVNGSVSRDSSPNTSQEQLLGFRHGSFRSQPSVEDEVEKVTKNLIFSSSLLHIITCTSN